MAVDKKFFVDINLQGNALNNATIGTNSDMTKAGSFRFDRERLEYYNGSSVQRVANLADISAVTGGLIFQGGYDAATNTPDIADGTALKGFFWVVTEAGSFLGESVQVGDSLVATVNAAGASIGDWLILQGNVVIATDSVEGIVRLGTQAEVDDGTEGGAVVVTPATLQSKIDSQVNPYADGVASTAQSNAEAYADGLAVNYDPAGSAATAQSNAETFATNAANTAQSNAESFATTAANNAQAAAESYADSLAPNYDAAGSATTAENNAKAYADSLAPNYDAAGSAATAESNANSYTDTAISQEVIDRDAAIATAKSEAIADANSYTDTQIAQEVTDRNNAIAAQTKTIEVFNNEWQGSAGGYYASLDFSPLTNVTVQVFNGSTYDLIEMGVNSNPVNGNVTILSNILPSTSILVKATKITL